MQRNRSRSVLVGSVVTRAINHAARTDVHAVSRAFDGIPLKRAVASDAKQVTVHVCELFLSLHCLFNAGTIADRTIARAFKRTQCAITIHTTGIVPVADRDSAAALEWA